MSELRTRRPAVFRYDDPAVLATVPAVVPPAEVARSITAARSGSRVASSGVSPSIEPLTPSSRANAGLATASSPSCR